MTADQKIIEALTLSNYVEGEYRVKALHYALDTWTDYKGRAKLLLKVERIKTLHEALLDNILHRGIVGRFRDHQVTIGGHLCNTHFEDVPRRMQEWCDEWGNLHNQKFEFDSGMVAKVKMAHIEFEKIHPFSDGNGRVGRFIMNLQLHWAGLAPIIIVPLSGVKTRTERDRVTQLEYYKWFTKGL